MTDPKTKEQMLERLGAFLDEGVHGLYPNQLEVLKNIYYFLKWKEGDIIWQPEELPKGFEGAKNKKLGDFFEIVSATSTGKTRAYGTLAKIFDVPGLITTPRILLNEQTRDEFIKDIGIPKHSVGIYDSSMSQKEQQAALKKPFLITTIDSVRSLNSAGFISDDPESPYYRAFAFIDENHERAQGANTSEHIGELLEKMIVGGFSATDAGAHETLFKGQVPIFHLGPVEAIEHHKGNMVSHAKGIIVDVDINPSWLKAFKLDQGKEYPEELISRITSNPAMRQAAIDTHFSHVDSHAGAIHRLPSVFAVWGVENAKDGAAEFNEKAEQLGLDVRAEYIAGAMSKDQKKDILARFAAGEINALWNDRLIGLGTDIADISVVHMLKPSRLSTGPTQLFGRALRKEGSDYLLSFGNPKVAIGISYRLPGMHPFTVNDVLGGMAEVWNLSEPPKIIDASEKEPLEKVRGIKIHSSPAQVTEVVRLNREAREEEMGMVPTDWMTITEASQLLHCDLKELQSRAKRISPSKQYSLDGLEGNEGEENTVAGGDLVRKRHGHGYIVSSVLVSAWKAMEEEADNLKDKGYRTVTEVADDSEISKAEVHRRLAALRKLKASANNSR